MATVDEIIKEIEDTIKEITPIKPKIIPNPISWNIFVAFVGEVPDEETIEQIVTELKKKDQIISHNYRQPELGFVCFLVHL